MKRIFNIRAAVFGLIILATISCKKSFLDVPDNSVPLRQVYVTDLNTTQNYLNGIYIKLSTGMFSGYSIIYPELMADNIQPLVGSSALLPHYSWTQTANESQSLSLNDNDQNMNGFWIIGFAIIRDCNFVIEQSKKYASENPKVANNLSGQAYGIRALVHSMLANVFAQPFVFTQDASHIGIPYVTTSDWTVSYSRASVGDVYKNIISDLQMALTLLPDDVSNKTVINKSAVLTLLSRTYFFEGNLSSAISFGRKVITQVPIMNTVDYPSKLFTPGESEAIFQIIPAWGDVGNGNYYTPFAGLYFDDPLHQFNATSDIADILNENVDDKRRSWISKNGSEWKVTKFPKDIIPGFSLPTVSYYQTLLRSSEISLILSESYARTNKIDSAIYFLDLIKKRANPGISSTTLSGIALQDEIDKERRKEFAFEGYRLFDLLRTKRGIRRADPVVPEAKNLNYPNDRLIAPIPMQDVKISGMRQNNGY